MTGSAGAGASVVSPSAEVAVATSGGTSSVGDCSSSLSVSSSFFSSRTASPTLSFFSSMGELTSSSPTTFASSFSSSATPFSLPASIALACCIASSIRAKFLFSRFFSFFFLDLDILAFKSTFLSSFGAVLMAEPEQENDIDDPLIRAQHAPGNLSPSL